VEIHVRFLREDSVENESPRQKLRMHTDARNAAGLWTCRVCLSILDVTTQRPKENGRVRKRIITRCPDCFNEFASNRQIQGEDSIEIHYQNYRVIT
jgi:hypothetical protein